LREFVNLLCRDLGIACEVELFQGLHPRQMRFANAPLHHRTQQLVALTLQGVLWINSLSSSSKPESRFSNPLMCSSMLTAAGERPSHGAAKLLAAKPASEPLLPERPRNRAGQAPGTKAN